MWGRKGGNGEKPSIYEHVRRHLDPGGVGLLEGGDELPDEADFEWEGGIRWAAGAQEGVLARYWGSESDDDPAKQSAEIHAALAALASRPSDRRRRKLRRLLREADPRSVLGDLIERFTSYPPRDPAALYAELRSMVLESGNRTDVKFALPLTGLYGRPEDAEVFRTLARHEEFTLYAALALGNVVEDPTAEWLRLLDSVSGWGKTEVTELLLRDPTPQVCHVLLRRGLSIGNALSLAVGCRLHEALAAPDVDDELLAGARAIVHDLVAGFGGPEELADYPDGAAAVERLLALLDERARTLDDFLAVYGIREYLREPTEAGFGEEQLGRVLTLAERILERPDWSRMAEEGLASPDQDVRDEAFESARRLGLPLHDYMVRELERRPSDSGVWFNFVTGADDARIEEALALARRLLDLEAIATGPARELGLGEGFELHSIADFLLQELERFPGKGWEVIAPALRSPVTRNRFRALHALAEWPADARNDKVIAALRALATDPDEDLREAAAAVVRGDPIPEPRLSAGG
jgi:hypothetical protein